MLILEQDGGRGAHGARGRLRRCRVPSSAVKITGNLSNKYKVKTEVLGGDPGDAQEVRVLNRVVQWTSRGVALEADPRHAEAIVREFGFEKAAATPGDKEQFKKDLANSEAIPLQPEDATRFRGAVARLNYMAIERPDVQVSVNELARSVSCPKVVDLATLNGEIAYLAGMPRLQVLLLPRRPQSDYLGNMMIVVLLAVPGSAA